MKKLINSRKVFENAPKGLKLYSPAYGYVYFDCIKNLDNTTYKSPMIICKSKSGNEKQFFLDGTISSNGRCMLFPDMTESWDNWEYTLIKKGDMVNVNGIVGKVVEISKNNDKIKSIKINDKYSNVNTFIDASISYANPQEIEEYNNHININKVESKVVKENKKETIVINLIGGPGCGKSTVAAGLFYELKRLGVSCELVCEYTKEKVWEESFNVLNDEIYLFAKQLHKQWRLKDKVDYIITDHCLLNSVIYNKINSNSFNNLVFEEFNKFSNINFFITRGDKYETAGRIETEEESKQLDKDFKELFNKNKIAYKEVKYDSAVNDIVEELNLVIKSGLDPYKFNLGDFITIEYNGILIISIFRCIKDDDLFDCVRLTIFETEDKKKLEINPINCLDELNKCMFSYRKATNYEKTLLLEEMQKDGWTWNSYKKSIEVYDI